MPQRKPEPTEQTPKDFQVRVPKRGEFIANLKKVAKVPGKGSATRSPKQ